MGGDRANGCRKTELREVVGIVADVVVCQSGTHIGGVVEFYEAAIVERGVKVGVDVGYHDFVDDERFGCGSVVGDDDRTGGRDTTSVDSLGGNDGCSLPLAGDKAIVVHGSDAVVGTAPRNSSIGGVGRDDGCSDGCSLAQSDVQFRRLEADALGLDDGTPQFQSEVVEKAPVVLLIVVAVDAEDEFSIGDIDLQFVVIHAKREVVFAALHAVGVIDVLADFGIIEQVGTVGIFCGILAEAGLDGNLLVVGIEVGIDALVACKVLVEEALAAVARAIEGAGRKAVVPVGEILDVLIEVERGVPEFACPHPTLGMADARALPAVVSRVVEVGVDDVFAGDVNPPVLGVSERTDE